MGRPRTHPAWRIACPSCGVAADMPCVSAAGTSCSVMSFHKSRLRLAEGAEVLDLRGKYLSDKERTSRSVPCPSCGAEKGKPCLTRLGIPVNTHAARFREARGMTPRNSRLRRNSKELHPGNYKSVRGSAVRAVSKLVERTPRTVGRVSGSAKPNLEEFPLARAFGWKEGGSHRPSESASLLRDTLEAKRSVWNSRFASPPGRAPRYDDVYANGVAALNRR